MKKVAGLLLVLLGMATSGRSQSSPREKNDSVCALVKTYFNEKSIDKLYSLTGEAFRKQINAELFQKISNDNLFPLGAIQSADFVKNSGKRGSGASV